MVSNVLNYFVSGHIVSGQKSNSEQAATQIADIFISCLLLLSCLHGNGAFANPLFFMFIPFTLFLFFICQLSIFIFLGVLH